MPTKVTVFNSALGILGLNLVSSDTAQNEVVRTLNTHWPTVCEFCHEKTAWDHAKARAECARLADVPVSGYDYYYALPSDCLRVLHVSQTGDDDDDLLWYSIEEGKIATSSNAVYLVYVSDRRIDKPGSWSQTFADFVAAELAVRSAAKLNPSAKDDAMKAVKRYGSDAIGLDATQGPTKLQRHGSWSRAARGNRFGNIDREQR